MKREILFILVYGMGRNNAELMHHIKRGTAMGSSGTDEELERYSGLCLLWRRGGKGALSRRIKACSCCTHTSEVVASELLQWKWYRLENDSMIRP